MTTVTEKQIEQEASEWYSLFLGGETTEKDKQQFQDWCDRDVRHLNAYKAFETIWEELAELSVIYTDSSDNSVLSLREGFQDLVEFDQNDTVHPVVDVSGWRSRLALITFPKAVFYSGVATALSLLITVLLSFFSLHNSNVESIVTHMTGVSEIKEVTLKDGSLVTMSADSHIEVSYKDSIRKVNLLSGHAFFDVVRDSSRPFIVNGDGLSVVVLGTRFDVHRNGEKTRVRVAEGAVEVSLVSSEVNDIHKEDLSVTLTSGDSVVATTDEQFRSKLSRLQKVDVPILTSWLKGRHLYQNARLEDIIFDASRFYDVDIYLTNESLKDLKLTTSFNSDQVDEMLSMLPEILPVSLDTSSSGDILISPSL